VVFQSAFTYRIRALADTSSHPFRQDLIGNVITTVHGTVPIPQNPGIGVEVDRAVLERYGKPFRAP